MLQHENPEVRALLCKMADLGFKFDVLGGYPRDLYFSRTPRDMDVCCYECKPDTVLWRNRFVKLLSYLQDKEIYLEEFAVTSEYPSDRIFGGIKTKVGVDIIFWLEQFESKDDILAAFDYNINQFYLTVDDFTGGACPKRWSSLVDFGLLRQLRGSEVSAIRETKIINLARQVGWIVSVFDLEIIPPVTLPQPGGFFQ